MQGVGDGWRDGGERIMKPDAQVFAGALRAIPEFAGLAEPAVAALHGTASEVRVPAGAQLIVKSDPADALMILVNGRLRVSAASVEGRSVAFRVVEPVEVVGEIAALDGGARTADVTAVQDSIAFRVPRAAWMAAMQAQPDLALATIRLVCRRLRDTSAGLERVATQRVPARLGALLLRLAGEYGRPQPDGAVLLPMRLSQTELSMLIASTREAVNKQLAAWREAGLLDVRAGYIVIRQPAALAAEE
jgi:CRP-like cAMP-binding protein